MKKVVMAMAMVFGAGAALYAQDTTTTQKKSSDQYNVSSQPGQDDYTDKDAINFDELPAPIKSKLQGTDYNNWSVAKSYRKMKSGKTMYAVELSNGNEKKKVKFDQDGNVLKEKAKRGEE